MSALVSKFRHLELFGWDLPSNLTPTLCLSNCLAMKIHMFSLKVVDSWPPSVNTCLAPFWIRVERKHWGVEFKPHSVVDTLWLCEQHSSWFSIWQIDRLTNEKLLKSYAWFWITFISKHPRYSFMVKDKSHPPHFKELLKALSPIVEEHFGLIVPGQRPK